MVIVHYPCLDGECIHVADSVEEIIELLEKVGKVYLDRHSVDLETWVTLQQEAWCECYGDGLYLVCKQ